jgi:hypothetical protein
MRCWRSLLVAGGCGCCCHRCCQSRSADRVSAARDQAVRVVREPHPCQGLRRRLCPAASGICLVTGRTVQGMAPYPGQARCLAVGFWPECFRRLNVKGGRRSFPEETRSALDIEGKHVTIQGSSPDLTSSVSGLPGDPAHIHRAWLRCPRCCPGVAVTARGRPPHRASSGHGQHLQVHSLREQPG